MMTRGQVDRVVAESSNGLVKLSCGMWINRDFVEFSTEVDFSENALKNGAYVAGENYDKIVWQSDVFNAVHARFDGEVLTVSFGMHTQTPELTLPSDLTETIFESVRSGLNGETRYYAFTIGEEVKFEGCHVI